MAANTTTNGSVPCMMQKAWFDGPTYADFLRYNQLIFLSILGLPVCLVGIVTSGLSVCMFCRDKTTPRTTRTILIVLSLVDVLYLLVCLFVFQPMNFSGADSPLRQTLPASILVALGGTLECFRNWLVVLICVERFLVVCFPVRSKVWWTGKITNGLIAACFGFSILVRLPGISYAVIKIVRPEWSGVQSWVWQLHCYTDSIMVTLIPLIILIVCSLQIGRGLRRSDSFRGKLIDQAEGQQIESSSNGESKSPADARRIKLTRGLLMVIVTFILFLLPLSIPQILSIYLLNRPNCVFLVTLNTCYYLVALGSQINSTANFFVCIVYWAKYRRMLRQMLCCHYANRPLTPKRGAF